jgi:dipeptidase D
MTSSASSGGNSFPLSGLALARLSPQPLWSIFADISQVPRESRKEAAIRRHVKELVESKGLKAREDAVGNLIVDVPATSGYENAPRLVLQAHLDMVCVKRGDSPHDFDKDPIQLIADEREGEPIIRANNTTLGADNGIGVALALSAALAPGLVHGPLELLFTVNEEAGMTGGHGFSAETVQGRWLLNLDTEEDNVFINGCAGATVSALTWKFPTSPVEADAETVSVSVSGLTGGHSGMEIHQGRGSAIKLLAEMLREASIAGLRLVRAKGGEAINAIPNRATIVVAGPRGTLDALERLASEKGLEYSEKLKATDPGVQVFASPTDHKALRATSPEALQQVLKAIESFPFGPMKMRSEKDKLVETSCNPAQLLCEETEGDHLKVELRVSTRSLVKDELSRGRVRAQTVGDEVNAGVRVTQGYPPWPPLDHSRLLEICQNVHAKEFGKPAHLATIHAGLECGLFAEKVPEMEMVSMGPRIEGAHTPEERVYVQSVERFWNYFVHLLEEVASQEPDGDGDE